MNINNYHKQSFRVLKNKEDPSKPILSRSRGECNGPDVVSMRLLNPQTAIYRIKQEEADFESVLFYSTDGLKKIFHWFSGLCF